MLVGPLLVQRAKLTNVLNGVMTASDFGMQSVKVLLRECDDDEGED